MDFVSSGKTESVSFSAGVVQCSMRDERWVGERLTAPEGDPVGVGQDGKVAMAVIGAIGHNPAAAR
jgi:hypothetical protein